MARENVGVTGGAAREAAAPRVARGTWWERHQRGIIPYVFISPFYILQLLFFVGPMIFAFYLSLTTWTGGDVRDIHWVGLANFQALFTDPLFYDAAGNTLWYMLSGLLIGIPLALAIAVVLNSGLLRGKTLFRTIYFIPVITPTVAVAIMFELLFDNQFGLINAVLQKIGLPGVYWLGDPVTARISVSIVLLWQGLGMTIVFFLAGLQSIPQDLIEAARVDGASPAQAFYGVTIPMLKPVFVFVIILALAGGAQIFDQPFILTNGGPNNGTISMVMLMYQEANQNIRFGYASSIAVILFVVVAAMTIFQMRVLGAFSDE